MDTLTPKTWEKSPNNKEIRLNLSYPVSRGLVTGLVTGLAFFFNLYKIYVCSFLHLFKNWKKTRICFTGLETGCKPVLFLQEEITGIVLNLILAAFV